MRALIVADQLRRAVPGGIGTYVRGLAQGLAQLDDEARVRGRTVAVGAGFAPGLSDLLATHAARLFDEVHEVHVARAGTGGPACARAHSSPLTRAPPAP